MSMPPIEETRNLSPSTLLCIQEDYENPDNTIIACGELWNLTRKQMETLAERHNWLTKGNRLKLEKDLKEQPKLLKKLANPKNQCHQELSVQEKLIIKKTQMAMKYQDTILDVGMKAIEDLKREGLELRSAFDLEKIHSVMSSTLGLDEPSKADVTVDVSFTNARHKPSVVVDVE